MFLVFAVLLFKSLKNRSPEAVNVARNDTFPILSVFCQPFSVTTICPLTGSISTYRYQVEAQRTMKLSSLSPQPRFQTRRSARSKSLRMIGTYPLIENVR